MTGPTRADFDRVATAHARTSVLLVRLLELVQKDANLRPISDKVFGLLADELAFAAGFERKLTEAADFLEAWRYLSEQNGRPPDRGVLEQLLAEGEPEMVDAPEPVVEPTFAEQPTSPLPVVEAEPPEVEEAWCPPSRALAEQLLRERTPPTSVWGRDEPGGAEPAA